MGYTNKAWGDVYNFIFYRLSLLVECCFITVTRYKINPYAGIWQERQQLILPCLKNGGMPI
jgi:hypothetical protein